jgi:hypothetical protein
MQGKRGWNLRLLRDQPALRLCAPATRTEIGTRVLTLAAPLETRTPATLLAQKQKLVERLQQDPGSGERDQIEHLLAEIDEALNFLDQDGSRHRT